ncbi:MAG: NAD(P)/FAD-dependent oxidoreductase [Lachnospiraceae bacterium]|nr:NAD(P)/FAD-dependent oxidoreductase [Lachnospiraceae bacterium]
MKDTDQKNRKADVIVIGAGASGMMAAVKAAEKGASVIVLDHNAVSGKKILSTGNGKCNFTNERQEPDCYRSDDPDLVKRALDQFSCEETVSFFERLGVYSKAKNGYYYPRSGQASAVRDALIAETWRLHIRIFNKIEITEIQKNGDAFLIRTKSQPYSAGRCILATGGISAPKTGSDGSGYRYAKQLGHTIIRPLPALVPLESDENWLSLTAGVRCDARVTLYIDGENQAEDTGELQLTEYGISGIPVFQISRYASVALSEKQDVEVSVDFLPELTFRKATQFLTAAADRAGDCRNWEKVLCGLCNRKIAHMICDRLHLQDVSVGILPEKTFQKQLSRIVRQLKETAVRITGTRSAEQAQVTCGGVPLKETDVTMQSKLVPGLYFAGEILNVDGICGGYNLQWAWTSGYIAGLHAAIVDRQK